MIDLPFFGESEWEADQAAISPLDWDFFFQQLVQRYPAQEIHFLAFSLGAKLALGLYQGSSIPIHGMTLISPDGLRIHPLYRFCIYHPVGKAMFYTVLKWPGLLLGILKVLHSLRITDPFKYRFVRKQFESKEKRMLLRRVWKGNAGIRPHLDAIARRSGEIGTVWHIIWGKEDSVLPMKLCEDFLEKVKDAKLHVVEGGHFLLSPLHDDVKSLLNAILNV